jgi:NitT/TauT family transport system substrate-binding protein
MSKLVKLTRRGFTGALVATAVGGRLARAQSADKVKVGMFPISSALPFYVALDLGYFKDLGIDPEVTRLMGGPPNVGSPIRSKCRPCW